MSELSFLHFSSGEISVTNTLTSHREDTLTIFRMFVCKTDQSHLNKNTLNGSNNFRKSQWKNGRDKTANRHECYHKPANVFLPCRKSSKLDGAVSFKQHFCSIYVGEWDGTSWVSSSFMSCGEGSPVGWLVSGAHVRENLETDGGEDCPANRHA